MRNVAATGLIAMLMLGACNSHKAEDAPTTTATDTASTTTTTNSSSLAVPATTPAAPAPAPALQSQPGPNGTTGTINKVAVTGQILTVQFTVSGTDTDTQIIPIDQISIIDDATSKKYSVLKDDTGKSMVSEVFGDNNLRYRYSPTAPGVAWMKFPAPPADTKTVSISIPAFGAFDGVPIAR